MKNADMPAMPLAGKINLPAPRGGDPLGRYQTEAYGLTKLEEAAFRAMQGLYACPEVNGSHEDLAKASVLAAKALLEELEKENEG